MKKAIFFLLLLIPFVGMSQVKIQMQEDGGVYKIPCEVNGLRMKFIFDTGASNVCISLTEATFMLENDYISKDDILGTSKSQIADGSIVENTRIRLKEIKIAGLVLKDIEAVVTHNFGAPLLLGQSAIQKLGTIQIVGNELTILEHNTEITDADIDRMFNEAREFYSNKSFNAAAKIYQELYDIGALSDYGIFKLAHSYYRIDNYKKSLDYFYKIKDFTDIDFALYYDLLGWNYVMLEDYENALYNFELKGKYEEDNSIYYGSKHCIAITYKLKGDYYKAATCFEDLLYTYLSKKDITADEYLNLRKKGKITDDIFDCYMFEACYNSYMQKRSRNHFDNMIGLAKLGNKYAIEFVKDRGLDNLLYE